MWGSWRGCVKPPGKKHTPGKGEIDGREARAVAVGSRDRSGQGALLGADDLEVLVDEDVVRPVDADVVDVVIAVAQLHDTVDDAPG